MPLTTLPNELLLSIAGHLNLISLSSLSRTTHHLNTILQHSLNAAFNRSALTFLVKAAGRNNPSIVRRAIASGLDPRSVENTRALDRAAYKGYVDVVRILVEHCTDINQYRWGHRRPLHHAARRGHVGVVEALLDGGAEVDLEEDGWTALWFAAAWGQERVVQVLLDRGAEINRVACDREMAVVISGNAEVLKVLVEWRAKMDVERSEETMVTGGGL